MEAGGRSTPSYQDFKTILKLTNLGAQYYEEGVEVLDFILSQMNRTSGRLSSNIAKMVVILLLIY